MFSSSSWAKWEYIFHTLLAWTCDLFLDNRIWVEVLCANFWVQKYLILFLRLLADAENFKDLEREDGKKKKKERRLDPWMTACVHCTLLTHTGFWKEYEINFYYNYLQRFADFFNVIAVSYPEMLRFADKIRSSTYRLSHISSHSISDFWLEVYNTFRSPRILYHILSSLLMCSSYK